MVNHLRTLLLNLDGAAAPDPSYPGEEYVPPDFKARALRGPAARAWPLVFGTAPDRALRNWRLRQLLGLLHAGELAEFVTALDPRVTYLPAGTDLFDRAAAGPSALPLPGTTAPLTFVGPSGAPAPGERLFFQWRLEVLGGTSLRLTQYDPAVGSGTVVVSAYAAAGGLSAAVPLPGSALAVRFPAAATPGWLITALARPARGLPDVLAAAAAGLTDDLADGLFGPAGSPEPYATFRNLWERHDQLPYRLGALVLALGYRLHEQAG